MALTLNETTINVVTLVTNYWYGIAVQYLPTRFSMMFSPLPYCHTILQEAYLNLGGQLLEEAKQELSSLGIRTSSRRLFAKGDIVVIPFLEGTHITGLLKTLYQGHPVPELLYFKVMQLEPSSSKSALVVSERAHVTLQVHHTIRNLNLTLSIKAIDIHL